MEPAAATALAAGVLAASALAWFIAAGRMRGMDMGVETELGSFGFFAGVWLAMMAAMMLPGAVPAALRRLRASGRITAGIAFTASYLAVWSAVGLAVYLVYRPHGTAIAGVLTIAAGLYELTSLKRRCRRRCRQHVRSGLRFGAYCLGTSAGQMALLVAVGAMSIAWMTIVAALVLVQKTVPPRRALDVPLALAIVALGLLILLAPDVVPGVMPPPM